MFNRNSSNLCTPHTINYTYAYIHRETVKLVSLFPRVELINSEQNASCPAPIGWCLHLKHEYKNHVKPGSVINSRNHDGWSELIKLARQFWHRSVVLRLQNGCPCAAIPFPFAWMVCVISLGKYSRTRSRSSVSLRILEYSFIMYSSLKKFKRSLDRPVRDQSHRTVSW